MKPNTQAVISAANISKIISRNCMQSKEHKNTCLKTITSPFYFKTETQSADFFIYIL